MIENTTTDRKTLEAAAFFTWLIETNGYVAPRLLSPGRYAAILPLMFTHAIIVGRIGDCEAYDDRWCYKSRESALAALESWNGIGEPEGWHRHPATGRRRPDGDASSEIINY